MKPSDTFDSMDTAKPGASTDHKNTAPAEPAPARRHSLLDRWARKLVFNTFSRITRGKIVVEEYGQTFVFGNAHETDMVTHITVFDPATYRAVATGGSIGSAESYMQSHWSCSDLVMLVRIMVANMAVLDNLDSGSTWLRDQLNRLLHLVNRNNTRGARRNIEAHYDLSNRFFSTFLDPTMMYSAAIFRDEQQSLESASVAKLEHICRRLDLTADDHLLEIGTGWGAMAIHAAQTYGCRVTTTTLSREQHRHATEQIAAAGLSDRITVLLKDYRELDGRFDKLVSIEMIEAVGHQYYSDYFAQCARLLKPHGLMLLQSITISDQRYGKAKNAVDFIQRYIFPGGCLPSNSVIASHVARDTDMQIIGLEDITRDYAMTLAHWRQRFLVNAREIAGQGFNEEFIRMWDYYLAYCQGGFMERVIHTAQFLLAKPECQLQPLHARLANR